MLRTRMTAAISTGLALIAGATPAAFAAPTTEPSAAVPAADRPGTHTATVRLVTGDRVTLTSLPGGRHAVAVQPAPGREHIAFQTRESDGEAVSVVPSDAEQLVSAGAVDRRLFDVSALVADGFDEAHSPGLPLIVASRPVPLRDGARTDAQAARSAAATADRLVALNKASTPSRDLTSIDARSAVVAGNDLGTFWKTLTSGKKPDTARTATTPRILLDGKVKAALDRSTAQIGAPTAWKAGYEGQGVKVAVLDTGADAHHPDLAGRIEWAKDFSGSGNTDDHFGHGTHVASIVGGTGAASGGTRQGVAPKAELLIGKVLDDNGYGSESGIIDGMEWAVASHAKVVNMSLGADGYADGTDPMSQALDALTASSGTLFVVAAGNAGPGQSTLGTPGAADAALTVGAVDRDDSLASFSSRGPRYGDGAVKPDVTAPGVGIVAARAAGTTLGDPVDGHHVSLSGTSMATPHVAGAAALLAQRHPDWSARQLKDALTSTAHTVPGTEVTAQGAGRIDLAAALGPVTATGSLALAPLSVDGGQGRRQATVRYTNTGDHPVTLSLDLKLATDTGRPLADGVVGVGATTVRIDPGATTEVPLRTDPHGATRGHYYGYLTATSADGTVTVHTTVSLRVHAPAHQLKVVYRDRTGQVVPGWLGTIFGADGFVEYTDREAGTALVEEGTYYVSSQFTDYAADGASEIGNVVAPEVKVTKDTTVTLNAAEATEVRFRTPRPAERYGVLCPTYYRRIDGKDLFQTTAVFGGDRFYTNATAPVTDGSFEFSVRTQMAAPQLRAKTSGSTADFRPYYEELSPVFGDRGERLTAVDAGTAQAPRFHGTRGKLAVLRDDESSGYDNAALARAAAAAGAEAVLLVLPDRFPVWTQWRPTGERMALPFVRASSTDGATLLQRMAARSTTVTFTGTARSPYMYDVMGVWRNAIPRNPQYTVSERDMAVVRATYHRTGASAWASEQRFAWRPYQTTAWGQWTRFVPVGQERVEYVSADEGTQWQHAVQYKVVEATDHPLQGGMHDDPHTYRPGRHTSEQWFGAVVRPSIPRGGRQPSLRTGNALSVYVPEFNDGTSHWSFAEHGGFGDADGDTATALLYRDGQLLTRSEDGAWGDFEVPTGEATYRLDLTTKRASDQWRFATSTDTSWTFRSGAAAKPALLPLLQLDYDVPVDARNAVGRSRTHRVGLSVRMQDGMAAPRGVTLKVETSYDDGRTWSTARTARQGDSRFTAMVERPARPHGDAYVTLRVTATDDRGNKVRQTVNRAYLHRGTE
ncbi:S8 family serine peptidase [Streptomyces sp. KAU_LT]|uniref:S8 family serine peptidase n=1 Tax=Streptomyces sp. KAU_LT TaxID=3046669 RepID=UPI0024B683EF|nr:S8 family serine peptidase [Streptomyces sp. KAU_LT]MDI9832743.1 S8 family serine peptidase [Streptomyces sp. KAU_LT]